MGNPEIFMPMTVWCNVSKIEVTIFVENGRLANKARGFVDDVCVGCGKPPKVNPGVKEGSKQLFKLEQRFVKKFRLKRNPRGEIVVGKCRPSRKR
jgi:hypothetical protein